MRRVQIALMACLAATGGCVRRTELVAVYPDGAADLVTILDGDPVDVRDGDALPSESNGWKISQDLSEIPFGDFKGKKTLRYTATLHVDAGKSLPESYASATTPAGDAALAMPSEIQVQRGDDGTRYSFSRTYRARYWNPIRAAHTELFQREELAAIYLKDPGEVTQDELKTLATANFSYQRLRQQIIIDEVCRLVMPILEAPRWLEIRSAAFRQPTVDDSAVDGLVARAAGGKGQVDILGLEMEIASIFDERLRRSLESLNISPAQRQIVNATYHKLKVEYDVTEDIGGDYWDVEVWLPGRIVNHNSDNDPTTIGPSFRWGSEIEPRPWGPELEAVVTGVRKAGATSECQRIRWEFCGEELYGRDYTIRATSFVPNQ